MIRNLHSLEPVMCLNLTDSGKDHTAEIFELFFEDHRSCRYHHDFLCFRTIFSANQASWLEGDDNAAREIARCLQCVLIRWQAARGTPFVRPFDQFVVRLMDEDFRRAMRRLLRTHGVAAAREKSWAVVLTQLYRLFDPVPHSSTYPTKAMMLLWPHVPAFDSNVRKALHCIPVRRRKWDGTPPDILALCEILGSFWARHGPDLMGSLQQGNHEQPVEGWDACPGRVLDMFFFAVGKKHKVDRVDPGWLKLGGRAS